MKKLIAAALAVVVLAAPVAGFAAEGAVSTEAAVSAEATAPAAGTDRASRSSFGTCGCREGRPHRLTCSFAAPSGRA